MLVHYFHNWFYFLNLTKCFNSVVKSFNEIKQKLTEEYNGYVCIKQQWTKD